jgi:hypothetical protein
MMKRRVLWPAKILLLTGVLSATIILAVRPAPSQAVDNSPGHLFTANRDRLAVCVQSLSGAALPGQAQAAIQGVLPAALRHPWWDARLPVSVVETDCAPAVTPFLLQPGAASIMGKPTGDFGPLSVSTASRFRIFVCVLPQAQITALFGDSPYRTAPQEFLCQEHTCDEVTTGICVSPQEQGNIAFLKLTLQRGIGLEKPTPPERVDPSAPRGR